MSFFNRARAIAALLLPTFIKPPPAMEHHIPPEAHPGGTSGGRTRGKRKTHRGATHFNYTAWDGTMECTARRSVKYPACGHRP